MNDPVVGMDVAEVEFARFGQAFGLNFDEAAMDDVDKAAHVDGRKAMIAAIQRGKLSVDEAGQLVYLLSKGERIIIRQPLAKDFTGPAATLSTPMGRTCALLASLTGRDPTLYLNSPVQEVQLLDKFLMFFTRG